jgi:hypothetical protein
MSTKTIAEEMTERGCEFALKDRPKRPGWILESKERKFCEVNTGPASVEDFEDLDDTTLGALAWAAGRECLRRISPDESNRKIGEQGLWILLALEDLVACEVKRNEP